ncbi:MAG TPA: sodium:proton antiporter, partial [Brevibacterium linens]|nr:sodium:proton antiporter [Brevibacterium linens]
MHRGAPAHPGHGEDLGSQPRQALPRLGRNLPRRRHQSDTAHQHDLPRRRWSAHSAGRDPPLFLGMLRGVPFEWTFGLWPYWLFVNVLLLIS